MKRFLLLPLLFFFGSTLLLSGCTASQEQIIRKAKDRVFPAVVFIKPIQEEFRGGERKQVQIFGSGAIISEEGYVVTNNHVAEKATGITCVLSDKEEVPAIVVGLDPETDLAVLKLDLASRKSKDPLPIAHFGDSDSVIEGDLVMAMGAPHGFERSVSLGIVSSTERVFSFAKYNKWLQTDAAINPGNSGGPLVNSRGEIVGINARGMTGAQNMGFAIPANVAGMIVQRLIDSFEKSGKESTVERAWTGITFQALRDFSKSTHLEATEGVLVASIDSGSPAENAGILAGDLILKVNDGVINGKYETDLPAVERLFADLPLGKGAMLVLKRSGDEKSVTIVPARKGREEGEEFECKKWGMTVREITKFADSRLHFHRPNGVYVLGLKSDGNARRSNLSEYDIVTRIGKTESNSLDDFRNAYEAAIKLEKGKRRLILKLIRFGYPQYVALDFEKSTEDSEE